MNSFVHKAYSTQRLLPWHLTILSDSTPSSASVLLTLFGAEFHVRHKVESARTGET